jgi:hypothetical protein
MTMRRQPWWVLASVVLFIAVAAAVYTVRRPAAVEAQATFAPIQCNSYAPFSSASSFQVITAGNANMFVYVCNFGTGSIGGSTYSIVEGTGTTCATNTKAMFGGTTAATGMGLAANGTFEMGSGIGPLLKTAVAGDNVCFIVAGTGPLAGSMVFVQQPF